MKDMEKEETKELMSGKPDEGGDAGAEQVKAIPDEPVKKERKHGLFSKKDNEGSDKQEARDDDLTVRLLKLEKKQLFYARLSTVFTCGMFLVLLYIALMLVPRAVYTLANANEALDSVHDTVAEAQESLGDIREMSKSLTTTSNTMNDLIVNNAETLTDSVEKLSELDIDGLNNGIRDLQDALGPLAETMRNMSRFSLFGR